MNQLDEVDSPFMSKTKLHSSDARNGRFCEWESRERKDNLTGARGIGPVDKVTSPSGRFVPYRVAHSHFVPYRVATVPYRVALNTLKREPSRCTP